jgi:hypothetical protein
VAGLRGLYITFGLGGEVAAAEVARGRLVKVLFPTVRASFHPFGPAAFLIIVNSGVGL